MPKEKVLSEFVEKMVAEKGVAGMTPEQQAQLSKSLSEKLEEQIEQAMIKMLSDEQLVQLETMLDSNVSDEALEKFFDESGVDFSQAAAQAMTEFRKAYMELEA